MLLLKPIRNWSFEELEPEVRANLVYRQCTRIGAEKVPDAQTLGRVARALAPQVIEKIHSRRVALAQEQKVVSGRRMRVDTMGYWHTSEGVGAGFAAAQNGTYVSVIIVGSSWL